MVTLLLAYALLNAACITILVVLAHDAPMMDDDPLPATLLAIPALPTNDNAPSATAEAAKSAARPLRPMHAIA